MCANRPKGWGLSVLSLHVISVFLIFDELVCPCTQTFSILVVVQLQIDRCYCLDFVKFEMFRTYTWTNTHAHTNTQSAETDAKVHESACILWVDLKRHN